MILKNIFANSVGYPEMFQRSFHVCVQYNEKSIAGVWNYQILLLVHGQVNGQNPENPLVQPRFTCPKIVVFSYFSKKTYVVGIH